MNNFIKKLILAGLLFFLFLQPDYLALAAVGEERKDNSPLAEKIEKSPSHRVVSLAASLSELVYALESEAFLVGRTIHCNFPSELEKLPTVGSYYRPDLEKIALLDPDICLAVKDGTPKAALKKLENMGIKVLSYNPKNLLELEETIIKLSGELGKEEEGRKVLADFKSGLNKLDARLNDRLNYKLNDKLKDRLNDPLAQDLRSDESGFLNTAPLSSKLFESDLRTAFPENKAGFFERPRVLFILQNNPVIAAGHNTFISELIERAGGVNALGRVKNYPRLSSEELIFLNPDIVIRSLMELGDGQAIRLSSAEAKQAVRGLENSKAAEQAQFWDLPPDIFNRPALRSLRALAILQDIFYPK